MDVTAQESSTYPSGPYVSSFFSELPTDVRFSKTHYQQITPHSSTEKASQGVLFVLDCLVKMLKKPLCPFSLKIYASFQFNLHYYFSEVQLCEDRM
jgi:hypothetical protein